MPPSSNEPLKTVSSVDSYMTDVLRIDGVYYDTAKLASIHPGGAMMVQMANGTDATSVFASYHRRRFPHAKYKHLQLSASHVSPHAVPTTAPPNLDRYWELCQLVQPIIASTSGFAPWYAFVKPFFWCALVMSLDLYSVLFWRPLYLTLVQSIAMAMVGLNVQHDANHGAWSRHATVNAILGLAQDLLGGSRVSWILHHNFIHHIYSNDPIEDKDIDIPTMRLHRFVPQRAYHAMQHIYVFLLLALFGLAHTVSNMMFLWSGPARRLRLLRREWELSSFMTLLVPLRLAVSLVHAPSVRSGLLGFITLYTVGGMYLAFFFMISHNFAGVEKKKTGDGECFVKAQVETSSTITGWFLGHLNGGLNYQIEHHLFPRVHHGYYYYIAPIVREYCEKHNIHYTEFHSVSENFKSAVEHISTYGHGLE